MSIKHRKIPKLPVCKREIPLEGHVKRSYPVGRHRFSRIFEGNELRLSIKTDKKLPTKVNARLITSINSENQSVWNKIPFIKINDNEFICQLYPQSPGLHFFWAEFSYDEGKTWIRDSVSDAWILVDPPQVDGLKMYTLIPNISGTISDWKKELPRIADLGFNAIHLLPITTLDISESPYSANDLFGIDETYLDKKSELNDYEQLADFIEEAKKYGISLCFDLVLNHVGINSKIVQKAPDWIVPNSENEDGLQRASYWCETGWETWDDLVLINYEHPSEAIRRQIWDYMKDYALFWANYANETGGFVRFDNLHSSHPDFVEELTDVLYNEYPELGILAEYFADESTLLHTGPRWRLNLHLATPWDSKFVPQLREYLSFIHRLSKHIRYFMPLTSHDSGTPAQEFGTSAATTPRYVASALMGTGATGIVQGVEYGEEEKIEFIGKRPKKEFPSEQKFGNFIRKINNILTEFRAFRRGDNCMFIDDNDEAIIAAYRADYTGESLGFIVACNFDIFNKRSVKLNLPKVLELDNPVKCMELLSGREFDLGSQRIELEIDACGAKVIKIG